MLLSATSSAKLGSSNGLSLGGGSSLSTWPQLTRPRTSLPRSRTPRAYDPIDLEAAVPLEPHLDDRAAGDEVGPARIADDQVADLLGPEADPVEVVGRLDAAPLELALEELGGDRPALDPHDRDDAG